MPFLGTTPTQGFVSSFPKQSFTPNGSTTVFTLTNPVATANDLEVFVGNIRQEPTTAYTAAGTTLTMSEAPASGLNFYVINKSFAQVTTNTPDNSVSTAKLINDAVTSAKIATNAVGSDALDLTVVNGPTFKAYKSAAQNSVTANTSTKVTFETELWDTASDYDVSNSRFTPSKAGYYLITAELQISHTGTTSAVLAILRKNGSDYAQGTGTAGNNGLYPSARASWIVPFNGSSDYVEIFVYGQSGGGVFNFATDQVYRNEFEGIWLRDL